jgi:hypothetical protein
VWGNDALGHGHARSTLDSQQGWSAGQNHAGQWMTIDAGFETEIHGVVLQSRLNSWQMITKFKLLTSVDGHHFTYVENGREFAGNNHYNVKNTVRIAPVKARYVRIEVLGWREHISARAALLVQMPKILDLPSIQDRTPACMPTTPLAMATRAACLTPRKRGLQRTTTRGSGCRLMLVITPKLWAW